MGLAGVITPTRILINQAVTLTLTAYTDGTATDQGTFTVGIVDANGDTVVSSGTAVTDNSDGTYEYTLAAQTEPNVLTVTWTESGGTVYATTVEVVGSHLFTEADARAFDAKSNGTAPLSSASEYTDAKLDAERNRVTDLLEAWTERSYIRRYCRSEFAGDGSRMLLARDGDPRTSTGEPLHRPGRHTDIVTILSATVNGTAVTASNVKVDPTNGAFYRTDGSWSTATSTNPRNIVIEYTYGLGYPVDGADQVAMMLLVDRLVPSAISDRAVSFTDELGTVRFETPGRFGNVSTIPEINAWVKAHSMKIPLG